MRKTYDSKFKSRVALEAMRGELTIAEIASKYQVHPNQVQSWKKRLQEGATEIFMNASERKAENKKLYTEDDLMQKIGRMQETKYGSVPDGVSRLGSIPDIRKTFIDFQRHLYQV